MTKGERIRELAELHRELGFQPVLSSDVIRDKLAQEGYKGGFSTSTLRKVLDPKKYGSPDWNQIEALHLGYNPEERLRKEKFLRDLDIELPKQDKYYKDNLRATYKYWTDPKAGRKRVREKAAKQRARLSAALLDYVDEANVYGDYLDFVNYPLEQQEKIARKRVYSTIDNLKKRNLRYEDALGKEYDVPKSAYMLTEAQEAELAKQLYPIKLKEVQSGTHLPDRMTISHGVPESAITKRGIEGERIASGLTTWENITNKKGKVVLISARKNAQLGAVMPPRYRRTIKGGSRFGAIPFLTGAAVSAASPFLGSSEAEAATPQEGILSQVDDFSNVAPSKSGWFGRVAPTGSRQADRYIDKRQERLDRENIPLSENELLASQRRENFMSALDWPSRKSEELLTGGQGYQYKWGLHPSAASLMQFGIDPTWLVGGPLVRGALKGPRLVKNLFNL